MQIAKIMDPLVQLSKWQPPQKSGQGLETCSLHVPPPLCGTKDDKKMEDAVARLVLQWFGTAGLGKGGNLAWRLKPKLRIPPPNLFSRNCLLGGFT